MTYSESIPKNITTSTTSKPSQPQIVIENTSDYEVFCNLIEILPNVDFALNGVLEIEIDNIIVLDNKNDVFRSYSKYPLPLGKKIQGRGEIRIFAWNKFNTDELRCDFNIHLSSKLENIPSVAIPLSQDQKNNATSEFETMFELLPRASANYTKLINMKGYKKLIVLLSKPLIQGLPTKISDGFSPLIGGTAYDGKLDTFIDTGMDSAVRTLVLEYPTLAQRHIVLNAAWNPNFNFKTVTVTLEISVDGVIWTNLQTLNTGDSSAFLHPFVLDCGTQLVKFVRVTGQSTLNPSGSSLRIYDIYDYDSVGGTGSLSFEIKNSVGDWVELIPSGEFGTVTSNSLDVVKQVGDVTTISVSGKTYALPSTQDRFRAKYSISSGGLTNAVDIQRVA